MIDFALVTDHGARVEQNVNADKDAFSIRGMTVTYGSEPAIYSVDMSVTSGSLTAIIGPNGAGTVSYTHLTLPTT